jgi:hypothetical protein
VKQAEGFPLADGVNAQSSAALHGTPAAPPAAPSEACGEMPDPLAATDTQFSAHRSEGATQETFAARQTIGSASDPQSCAHWYPGAPQDGAATRSLSHGGDSVSR